MSTGYTRQSAADIVTSNTIQASHFNAEYNLIQSSFDSLTGHNHDGTTGGGAKIPPAGMTGLTNTSAGILCADGVNSLNVRTLTAPAAGITISNGTGASGNPTLALANDLSALEGLSSTGIAVRSASDTWVQRVIAAGSNISVSNGDGVSGNPTIAVTGIGSSIQAYDAGLAALAAFNTNGIVCQTADNTFAGRTLTGTTDKITVTNGDGVSGNPTVTIAATYAGQTSINTLGTISTGTWNGSTLGIAYGGTGQTTANAAFNALVPSQTGNSGKALGTNGTDTAWVSVLNLGLGSSSTPTYSFTGDTNTGLYSSGADIVSIATGGSVRTEFANSGSAQTLYTPSTTSKGLVVVGQAAQTAILLDLQNNSGTTQFGVGPSGIVTAGTWNGTAIGAAYGGTGQTSLTANNVILGNGTSAVQFVAPGTSGNILTSNGTTWVSSTPAISGSPTQAPVRKITTTYTAYTGSHTVPQDDTLPTTSETEAIFTATSSLTCNSTSNFLRFEGQIVYDVASSGDRFVAAIFVDSDVSATYVIQDKDEGNNNVETLTFCFEVQVPNTSAHTYTLRCGTSSGNSFYINGDNTGRYYGGGCVTYFKVTEIKA